MRIPCPLCGDRDLREFTYLGDSIYLDRPERGDAEGYDRYLHLRENPAGPTRELWFHSGACGAWLEVTRNTVTHEITGARLVSDTAETM